METTNMTHVYEVILTSWLPGEYKGEEEEYTEKIGIYSTEQLAIDKANSLTLNSRTQESVQVKGVTLDSDYDYTEVYMKRYDQERLH